MIADGHAVGEQLPNEKQLAEQLDVSRSSVREALGQLAAEGSVQRRWGIGTFVSAPRASSLSMSAIRSYRDRVRDAGREVSLRDASFDRVNATAEQAQGLDVPVGTKVWKVRRLFTADGVPSAYMVEHIPLTVRGVAIDPSSMMQLEYGLFDMLDQHVPGAVSHTSTDIEAVTVDATDAQLLGIHAGMPVLRTEQLTTDRDGTVLAYGVTLQRTDVLRMRITR